MRTGWRKYPASSGSMAARLKARSNIGAIRDRLRQVEHAGEREKEVQAELAASLGRYLREGPAAAPRRVRVSQKFEQAVEDGLREVAMESAKFQVQISA